MCSYPLEKWLIEENQLAEKDTKLYQLKAIEIPAEILKNKSIIRTSRVCQAKLL